METKIEVIEENGLPIMESPKNMDGFVVGESMVPVSAQGKKIFVPLHKASAETFRCVADCIDMVEEDDATCLILVRPEKGEFGVLIVREVDNVVVG